jgi:hypothetical protein
VFARASARAAALLAIQLAASAATALRPVFQDPHYHRPCDAEVVWNPHASEWWGFHTARRATLLVESGGARSADFLAREVWPTR